MKKIILPILTAILFASSSCVKDTCKDVTTAAPASEVAILDAYITSNSIAATKDTRCFYFKINTTAALVMTCPPHEPRRFRNPSHLHQSHLALQSAKVQFLSQYPIAHKQHQSE